MRNASKGILKSLLAIIVPLRYYYFGSGYLGCLDHLETAPCKDYNRSLYVILSNNYVSFIAKVKDKKGLFQTGS